MSARRLFVSHSVVAAAVLAAAACAPISRTSLPFKDQPAVGPMTATSNWLAQLPPPPRPLVVAVYDFPDQTGALKPNFNTANADFSRAVTQGASSVLVDTLKFMGNGAWFTVVERSRLEDLLRERKLVQDTYAAVKRTPEKLVSPLQFAEYLFEGGIISFDSTVVSGGVGATYLGIGPSASYLKNFITVTLRLVEVRTGRVVSSVTTSKSIFSVTHGLSLTKYISVDQNLLEVHGNITHTEPTQIAVREAIESAAYQVVREASDMRLWSTHPPEVLPPHLLADAMRDSFKQKPNPSKPSSPAQKSFQPIAVDEMRREAVSPSAEPAFKTAANTPRAASVPTVDDLLWGSQPLAAAGKFH